jgi:hypothetical protein
MEKYRALTVASVASVMLLAAAAMAENNIVYTIEAVPPQTVSATGTGDSCAFFSPAKKAEDEAKAAALRSAKAKCSITSAQCSALCRSNGAVSGTGPTFMTGTTVYSLTIFTQPSCGWHALSTVTARCGCACSRPI